MVEQDEGRRRAYTRGPGHCKLCGRPLKAARVGQPAYVAPAFAFRAMKPLQDDVGAEPCGVTHKAGTRICTRHELVWDVNGRKPRAVVWPEGGAR